MLVVRSGPGAARNADSIDFATAQRRDNEEVATFEPEWLPFDHPLWIVYSSGTTGLPKAIVHCHGGMIISGCLSNLQFDIGPSYAPNTFGERFHWYSTTGWVMWNIQVGGLLSGTTICLFDGAPSGPKTKADWKTLWKFAARHRVTWFGAGAAFYSGCRKAGLTIADAGDLRSVRALGSTGSPLPADVQLWGSAQFEALGRRNIWWCNVSGGTDIVIAFLVGNRELPPTPGRLQCRHLGAAVEAWNDEGRSIIGRVGELVCTRPLPSMPLYFWGDQDGSRYRSSYFNEWAGIWRHGDWLQIEADGSCIISGRSDATINRQGLRMGTAEIYAAVESLTEIADSLVIDLEDGAGGSTLLMFVVPKAGRALDAGLKDAMTRAIRTSLSPRFVPDIFVLAPAIPRTLSGKKQELPLKRLFQGWPVEKVINRDMIENPEVIPWYLAQARDWLDRSERVR
jgi:acetoacetyl-CoA synthetase